MIINFHVILKYILELNIFKMYLFGTFLFKMQVRQFTMFLKPNLYKQPIFLINSINTQSPYIAMYNLHFLPKFLKEK